MSTLCQTPKIKMFHFAAILNFNALFNKCVEKIKNFTLTF